VSPPGHHGDEPGDPASGSKDAAVKRTDRSTAFALSFWFGLAAFVALDWQRSEPHNRFDEPPPWALRQPAVEGAGHCAAPLK